jgi:hypothetical protein
MTAIASIRTKFIPATDTTGSRIMAAVRNGEFKGKQTTVDLDHAVSDPHGAAAEALVAKLGIVGDVVLDSEHETGRIFAVVPPIVTPDAGTPIVEILEVPSEVAVPSPLQVVTRYAGSEGLKGERVGARMLSGEFSGKRVTIGYDYAAKDPHKSAVHALLAKVGVDGAAVDSGAGIDNGYVYDIVTS